MVRDRRADCYRDGNDYLKTEADSVIPDLKGSSLGFPRLNRGPKAVMSAAPPIAINTVLLVGAGYRSLTHDFDIRAGGISTSIIASS